MSKSRPGKIELDKVKPTRTLLIESTSCEEKTAHIRNEAVNAIEKNDAMEVGYRYLQSRRGQTSTNYEIIFSQFYAMSSAFYFYLGRDPILIVSILVYLANILPNRNNRLRYQETEDACEKWLKRKFGEQEFKKIENMSYSKEGLDSLTLFLRNKHITATEKQRENIEIIQNTFISFTLAYLFPETIFIILLWELAKLANRKWDSYQQQDANARSPSPHRL